MLSDSVLFNSRLQNLVEVDTRPVTVLVRLYLLSLRRLCVV